MKSTAVTGVNWSVCTGRSRGTTAPGAILSVVRVAIMAPHSALFPRIAAVVHHAGAGTTAAGLRAGVPAVPVPIQFDERFWAARLVALGVAPRALPLRRLTADTLGAALVGATRDTGCRERARTVGAPIRAEDGTAPVVAAVNRPGS